DPERSSSAVTLSAFGSRVGTGVGLADGFAAVHAPRSRTSATTSGAVLGARSIRKRIVRGVHVRRRVLRTRIGLALSLRDGLLDLIAERGAHRFELFLGNTGREEVGNPPHDRTLGHQCLDSLLGLVAALVGF